LDWARNRAIVEAKGELLAYTDDDVVVDAGWIKGVASAFAQDAQVMAVTGLVVPYELETRAQILFERYGGFNRGYQRKQFRLHPNRRRRWTNLGAGQCGTGANMAYRLSVFEQIGGFDPALDVGTVTNGGGDLEMFYRVQKEGYTLAYEPSAIVRHRHRRSYDELKTQIRNNGIGFYSYLIRCALAYPEERSAIARIGMWTLRSWILQRLLIAATRPGGLPPDLHWAELHGAWTGLSRYQRARRVADRIANAAPPPGRQTSHARDASSHAIHTHNRPPPRRLARPRRVAPPPRKDRHAVGIRTIDLAHPLASLQDVSDYRSVRVFVTSGQRLMGDVTIDNWHRPISAAHLRHVVASHLGLKLLTSDPHVNTDAMWSEVELALRKHYMPKQSDALYPLDAFYPRPSPPLSSDVKVSVVVATYDRPQDLAKCLRCLVDQASPRPVEILVVDNNPTSGLTPPVVAEFPGVILQRESRQGLSYARNKGILASTGDIIVATDDDVRMPPHWLETLVAPFARSDVWIVTGNVLPFELETQAQRIFERYGGLGRGYDPKEVGNKWFASHKRGAVPTWKLGGTANAAFRAEVFADPDIGLLDEALGAGTPTGCSEDTYIFYQTLRAGYTILYEPAAFVWHIHRRDLSALQRQIFNYSKGHMAYHLKTFFRYHDIRALRRVMFQLPLWHLQRVGQRMLGWLSGNRRNYPFRLLLTEIAGHHIGPWALLRSQLRVRRLGRSEPYIPASQRLVQAAPSDPGKPFLEPASPHAACISRAKIRAGFCKPREAVNVPQADT
jgi:GT2 family glycosyltransferase